MRLHPNPTSLFPYLKQEIFNGSETDLATLVTKFRMSCQCLYFVHLLIEFKILLQIYKGMGINMSLYKI